MKLIFLSVVFLLSSVANASQSFDLSLIDKYERKYKIPKSLFHAVAIQESGRLVNGVLTVWPWALNIGGESFYFETRHKAYLRLKEEVDGGRKKQLGVGIGQLEVEYHGDKFESLWDMLDPELNIRVSSGFLKESYNKTSSWVGAIAIYHAGSLNNKKRLTNATKYVLRVKNHHENLL